MVTLTMKLRGPFLLLICTALIVGGGILTAVTYISTQRRVSEQTNLKFDEVVSGRVDELLQHMESFGDLLYATRGLFAATDVQAGTWNSFIQAQSAPDRYAGMKAIAYAEIVPPEQLASYEESLQSRNAQTTIYPEKKESSEHAILTYHEQVARQNEENKSIIGFDLSTDETRRDALERAKNSGVMVATSRIELAENGEPGFLLILPLHDLFDTPNGQPVFGYSIAAFNMSALIESTIGERLEQYQTSLTIADTTASEPVTLYEKTFDTWNRTVKRDVSIQVADRTWQMTFEVPTGNLLTTTERIAPTVVLILGVGFLALFCILIYAVRVRYRLRCTINPNTDFKL